MIYFTKDIFTVINQSKYFSEFGSFIKPHKSKIDSSGNINILDIPLSFDVLEDNISYLKYIDETCLPDVLNTILSRFSYCQILNVLKILDRYFPSEKDAFINKLKNHKKNFKLDKSDTNLFIEIFGKKEYEEEFNKKIKLDKTNLLLLPTFRKKDAILMVEDLINDLTESSIFFSSNEDPGDYETIDDILYSFNNKIEKKVDKYPPALLEVLCEKIGPIILEYIDFDLTDQYVKLLFNHLPGKHLIRFDLDYYTENRKIIKKELKKLNCILNTSNLSGFITNDDLLEFKIKISGAKIISKDII